MSGDASKVVDITNGQPIVIETTTSDEIMAMIDALRSVAAGEKHLAVGMFLVDAEGRAWTNFLCEEGSWIDSLGASSLLKHRILVQYEKDSQ